MPVEIMLRRSSSGRLLLGAILCSAVACDGPTDADRLRPIGALEIVSGDQQSGTVGEELPEGLEVLVLDVRGQPIEDYLVNFRVTSGGGEVFAGSSLSNAEGVARERWTLGTSTAEPHSVEARAIDGETGAPLIIATFTAEALPAAPDSIAPHSGSGQVGIIGRALPLPLIAKVTDRFGNPVPETPVSWVPANAEDEHSDELTGLAAATDAEGLATASWTLSLHAGDHAAFAVLSSSERAEFSAVGIAGPAARLAIDPDSLHFDAIGDTLDVSVVAFDADGNETPIQESRFTISDPSVATTSGRHVVSARQGSTSLSIRVDGIRDSIPVRVDQVAVSVRADADSAQLPMRGAVQLGADAVDRRGVPLPASDVQWQSMDPAVVAVDSTGLMTAVGPGRTEVVVRADGAVDGVPVWVTAFPAEDLATGAGTSCALVEGRPYCWGFFYRAESGAPAVLTPQPAPVPGAPGLAALFAESGGSSSELGGSVRCGLTSAGEAYCWGYQLPLDPREGIRPTQLSATRVVPGLNLSEMAVGNGFMCGLAQSASVFCWGNNDHGQLGSSAPSCASWESCGWTPVPVETDAHFRTVKAGNRFACALDLDGLAYCWGWNGGGQLGDGSTDMWRHEPGPVSGTARFVDLSLGAAHACGLTSEGEAYCWGDNESGALGLGSTASSAVPVPVDTGLRFTTIDAGEGHTCALAGTTAYCWGENEAGAVGDGSTTRRLSPTRVSGSIAFVELALASHSCGRATDLAMHCWGDNGLRQLGDGTREDRTVPVPVEWKPIVFGRD